MSRDGWAVWLALSALLCVPALWPLLTLPFFASDDGLFHLYRVAALDDALRQGVLYPRLFPSFAFGYGQAVLAFYGPLSYYVTELWHLLGANFSDALKWTFALGYVASGWTMFALARQYVSRGPALLAALVYVYFPYHLAETYQRGALAEHLAFVFLPLVLCGMHARRSALVLALSLAALIVTHTLTTLIFLPFALIYGLLVRAGALRERAMWLSARVALALGLSACYWLPILVESRWVGLSAMSDSDGYRAHFMSLATFVQPSLLFQYPTPQTAAVYPLGLWSLVLLVLALPLALRAWRARAADARVFVFAALLTTLALFMTLDLSLPLWRVLHGALAFLQYPWRFMTLVALGLALCAAFVFRAHQRIALVAALVFAMSSVAQLAPRALAAPAADPLAMWQNDFKEKQIGATWTAEYMPRWTLADRTAIPAAARAPVSEAQRAAPRVTLLTSGYTNWRMSVAHTGDAPAALRLHQFYLPQWRATLDGQPLVTYPSTDLGLLSVDVPPRSRGEIVLDFALTDLERAALFVSLVSFAWLAWRWRGRWLIALSALALPFVLTALTAPQSPISSSQAQVGEMATLLGVRYERETLRAGDSLRVTLFWLAQRETRENFKAFVHVMDASGAQLLVQSDSDPLGGFTPTSQWRAGEVIADTRELRLPADAAPGTLQVFAGMYRFPSLQTLTATDAQGQSLPNGRIPIGVIHVDAR